MLAWQQWHNGGRMARAVWQRGKLTSFPFCCFGGMIKKCVGSGSCGVGPAVAWVRKEGWDSFVVGGWAAGDWGAGVRSLADERGEGSRSHLTGGEHGERQGKKGRRRGDGAGRRRRRGGGGGAGDNLSAEGNELFVHTEN